MTKSKTRKQYNYKVGKAWPPEDRRNDIKNQIRNVGISRLPSYPELSEKYGVGRSMICQDVHNIITQLDPRELDEVFTDFYQADLKALEMLREILLNGNNNDKLRAITALTTLQKGATELLEAYGKKAKVADKVEVATVSYNFTITRPETEKIKIIKEGTERNELIDN